MSSDLDQLIHQRKLRRRLSLWRAAAIILLLLFIVIIADRGPSTGPYVARVSVEGAIIDPEEQIRHIRSVKNNNQAKALIVHIDSPGGTTAGSEALYKAIRDVAEVKPVAATIGTLGASGGYITAIGTDYIVARQTSITGSIGVIYVQPEISGLLDKIGVRFDEVKSTPLKGEPSFYEPMSDEVREKIRSMIMDSYDWFVGLVAERRNLSAEQARLLGDGTVFTGRQALEAGLIDKLGGEEDAREWLQEAHDISTSLPTIDVDVSSADRIFEQLATRIFGKSVIVERLGLDGLVSVWQPQ